MNTRAHLRAQLANQRGMTLVEIMVVIAIIGIVTTAIGFAVVGYMSDARIEAARLQVKKVSQAAAQSARMNSSDDVSLDELVGKKYIKEADKKDPWGNDLTLEPYDSPDLPVRVCSLGPDGKSGGDDDLCEPEKE
tara:strand:+ start:100 stop:504 length:405 start_codon:yes stop_codon:yes gene_type:complete